MRITVTLPCFLLISSLPSLAHVTPESCLDINRSVGVSMTDAMIRDFGIGEQEIVLNSTVMTLIDKNRVTLPLALLYAKQSYNQETTHFLSESELTSIFMTSNSTNIIVKYDYVNHENKHNVTIASLLVNDDECSVRFNDYIVIKREF